MGKNKRGGGRGTERGKKRAASIKGREREKRAREGKRREVKGYVKSLKEGK